MIRAGVIGWPVAHSLSPRLHGFWLDKYKIHGRYDALPIAPDQFEQSVRTLVEGGIAGFNVTLPYKTRIADMMDEVSPRAQAIGAVNTVVVMENGGLLGDNTDAYGFMQSLNTQVEHWKEDAQTAVIIGAGGAAMAIAYALLEENVPEIKIYNRTPDKAAAIIDQLSPLKTDSKLYAYAFSDLAESIKSTDLLINTTPLGMTGQKPLDLDIGELPSTAIVSDIVYAPRQTALLKSASDLGLRTAEGLPMLIHQAVPGFEYWFNKHPAVEQDVLDYMFGVAAS